MTFRFLPTVIALLTLLGAVSRPATGLWLHYPRPRTASPTFRSPILLVGLTKPQDWLWLRPGAPLTEENVNSRMPENLLAFARSHGHQELASVEREIRKLVQAIKDGVSAVSIQNKLLSLEARQTELRRHLEAPQMPQLLHHGWPMSTWRRSPASVTAWSRNAPALRTPFGADRSDPARAGRRAIEDHAEGRLDLAGMLGAARNSKRSPETGDLMLQRAGCGGGI